MRMAPARIRNLRGVSIRELRDHAIRDLGAYSLKPGHDITEQISRPWHSAAKQLTSPDAPAALSNSSGSSRITFTSVAFPRPVAGSASRSTRAGDRGTRPSDDAAVAAFLAACRLRL